MGDTPGLQRPPSAPPPARRHQAGRPVRLDERLRARGWAWLGSGWVSAGPEGLGRDQGERSSPTVAQGLRGSCAHPNGQEGTGRPPDSSGPPRKCSVLCQRGEARCRCLGRLGSGTEAGHRAGGGVSRGEGEGANGAWGGVGSIRVPVSLAPLGPGFTDEETGGWDVERCPWGAAHLGL